MTNISNFYAIIKYSVLHLIHSTIIQNLSKKIYYKKSTFFIFHLPNTIKYVCIIHKVIFVYNKW